jgi:hypothetical protein
MASETWGSVSATRFKNTVSESKMVTPETNFLDSIFAEHLQKNPHDIQLGKSQSEKWRMYIKRETERERFTFCS